MHRLNIVLFGATGYTGRATIPALYKLTKKGATNLTWGVAGRSREKLEKVLQDASTELSRNHSGKDTILLIYLKIYLCRH